MEKISHAALHEFLELPPVRIYEAYDTPLSSLQEYWVVLLNDPETRAKFAQLLKKRWENNSPSIHPLIGASDECNELANGWSLFFALFCSRSEVGTSVGVSILEIFEECYKTLKPTMSSGTVWFMDCLALRHLRSQNTAIDSRIVTLLLDTAEKVVGQFPASTHRDYDYFYQFYSELTLALAQENYEEQSLREEQEFFNRLAHPRAFSWLNQLEIYRQGKGVRELPIQCQYQDRYRQLLRNLFMSLVDINALSMETKTVAENRTKMLSCLREFERTKDSALLSPFVTVQKVLDASFLRMSRLVHSETTLSEWTRMVPYLISYRSSDSATLQRMIILNPCSR